MARKILNGLNMVQSARLINLIDNEYVSSKLTNTPFAEHATKVLGYCVTAGHVAARLEQMDIPSNGRPAATKTKPGDMAALHDMMAALEKRIDTIEKTLYRRMTQVPLEYTEPK